MPSSAARPANYACFESLADVDGDRKADFALNLRSNQSFSADVLLL